VIAQVSSPRGMVRPLFSTLSSNGGKAHMYQDNLLASWIGVSTESVLYKASAGLFSSAGAYIPQLYRRHQPLYHLRDEMKNKKIKNPLRRGQKCSNASRLLIVVFALSHPTSSVSFFARSWIRTLVVEKGLASPEPPHHVAR
jgi:hypothetical protein